MGRCNEDESGEEGVGGGAGNRKGMGRESKQGYRGGGRWRMMRK